MQVDWSSVSAIGQAVGAIATTAAVFIALWQTKYANKKKVKVSFVGNMTLVPTIPLGAVGHVPKNRYVGVDVTNVGNRKIIIKSFWIEMPNGARAVIQPDVTPIGTVSMPIELDIEENVFLPWQKDKFVVFLKNNASLTRNNRIVFCVADTTGATYKCKTQKPLQYYLDEQ